MSNREIKFRGIGKETGEWVYGSLVQIQGRAAIVPSDAEMVIVLGGKHILGNDLVDVRPETVGQFTGLHDKNEKEIYEGDVDPEGIVVIYRADIASFALRKNGWMHDHYFGEAMSPERFEITGNIHEQK